VHGTAPDIAGTTLPIRSPASSPLRCACAILRRGEDATLIERAVERVLDDGFRTGDIMQPGKKQVGTREMATPLSRP